MKAYRGMWVSSMWISAAPVTAKPQLDAGPGYWQRLLRLFKGHSA
ncbi:hypothetical protein [Shewanella jiangmenensis]|nr:hypothetical protein [Shewanella jiangmenensis]